MSIAFGEGIQPASPLKYIKDYCGTSCWAPEISLDSFMTDTSFFDLNQKPNDGQDTLGPWQTMTAVKDTNSIDTRISEAIGYLQSCCMDGTVTMTVNLGSVSKWCTGSSHGNCVNTVDGHCTNPYFPNTEQYPVTTILKSNLDPALTWCGCATSGTPTCGYSGRCAQSDADFYSQYEQLAQTVCAFAA